MAISETALRDTVLMMVEWQNSRGGLNGGAWRPSWWTPPPTGRSSPRRRASCCRWRSRRRG
jgi:hypothetical protein